MAVLCTAFPAFAKIISNETTGASCGANLTWEYDTETKTLTISGTGAMRDFDWQTGGMLAPWVKNKNIYNYLETVVISYGVTSIGEHAFYYCENLKNITIPSSVKSIGMGAFYCCNALMGVTIPEGVKSIGDDAFQYCDSLKEVTIPGSVKSIGEGAFSSCDELTKVTIQDGAESMGAFAFNGCKKLTDVTLTGSVTSIGDNAFYNTAYYNDESKWENGVLYIGNHLIKADEWALNQAISKKTISSDYVVKSGTKTIADCAFYYCNQLTSIEIPNDVVSIGNRAFDSCNSLKSITIPKSVIKIGDCAFYTCFDLSEINVDEDNTAYCSEYGVLYNKEKTELIRFPKEKAGTSFTIPNSVTKIADGAFEDCRNLKSVTIPNSVTSIGNDAFNTCSGLTSVTIPDGVTSLGNKAFFGCSSLTSVTIPNSVTSIGEYAFSDCNNLKQVNYIGSEADWAEITTGKNYSIAENIIMYCKGINVVPSDEGRRIVVRPINIESDKTVILALYDGNKFIEFQSRIYGGTEITFTTDKAYTCAKVMIWNSLSEMSPVCDFKIVK